MKRLSKRINMGFMAFSLVIAQVIMPVQSALAYTTNPAEDPSYNSKSYVCKMVGKPGENERLQTGNNPIQVDRKAGDTIGTQFTDAQDRSFIVGFGHPNEPQNQQPDVDDCAALLTPTPEITVNPCTPGTVSTDSVSVRMTNNDSVTGNTAVYTVTINGITQTTGALSDGQSQILTFSNIPAGTYPVSVSAFRRVVFTGSVTVNACTAPERITTPDLSLEGVCGLDTDTVTVSASDDYTASAPTWNNSVVSVTFTMNAGINKVFAANGLKTITVTANEVNTAPCQTPPTRIETPDVDVDGICGIGNDTVDYVTETADYTSTISWNQANTSATITFTIKDGVNKVFAANSTKTVSVTVNETNTDRCPQEPQPCTVMNNQYQQPWTYDGKTYPVAGASTNTPTAIKGTYEFVNDLMFSGLHVKTLGVESYVYGMISAGNTSILDVDAMGYTTYRTPMEARSRTTLPAYILLIDKDSTNAPSVADRTYLFFEPYYSELVQEGVWKTWDAYKNGDAIWYMSGTGQTLRTWDYFKANFPDATVLAYGFNQGTYNEGTDAYIKSMTFDCATTTFSAPGRGGAGGETPTAPPVTTPTTPGMGNAGANIVASSALPALLPETGGMSMNGTVVALAAALATYGAVYFAQGKRRYE